MDSVRCADCGSERIAVQSWLLQSPDGEWEPEVPVHPTLARCRCRVCGGSRIRKDSAGASVKEPTSRKEALAAIFRLVGKYEGREFTRLPRPVQEEVFHAWEICLDWFRGSEVYPLVRHGVLTLAEYRHHADALLNDPEVQRG